MMEALARKTVKKIDLEPQPYYRKQIILSALNEAVKEKDKALTIIRAIARAPRPRNSPQLLIDLMNELYFRTGKALKE